MSFGRVLVALGVALIAGCATSTTVSVGSTASSAPEREQVAPNRSATVVPPPATLDQGTIAIEGVLVQPDDRTLTLTVLGGTYGDIEPTDPCWEGYRPDVQLSPAEVVITVHRLRAAEPVYPDGIDPDTYGCNTAGRMWNVEVSLAEPLGARPIIDGSDGTTKVVGLAATLLTPSWLPEGMTAGQADGHDGAWIQRWYGTESGPNAFVWLNQNPDPTIAATFPKPSDTVLDRPEIRGIPAVFVQQTGAPFWTLAWNEAGGSVVLQTGPNLGADGGLAPEQLIAIAQSLQPTS